MCYNRRLNQISSQAVSIISHFNMGVCGSIVLCNTWNNQEKRNRSTLRHFCLSRNAFKGFFFMHKEFGSFKTCSSLFVVWQDRGGCVCRDYWDVIMWSILWLKNNHLLLWLWRLQSSSFYHIIFWLLPSIPTQKSSQPQHVNWETGQSQTSGATPPKLQFQTQASL